MILKKAILFFVLTVCQLLSAQADSILKLDEVEIPDRQLKNFSNAQSVQTLGDSVLRKNRPSLTALLNFNSSVYFKENGPGMVSSPSFRGTTAQQTAVVWNGININSRFNGQTDFNTITAKDFDNISIRAGGGSVLYGSSAIGGSIHLNNVLRFAKHFDNAAQFEYGSFNTIGFNYKLGIGNEKLSLQASVSHNSSDNDYELPSGRENVNGKYYNTAFDLGIGYRIDARNRLKWLGYVFDGDRHFSLISPSDTKTKYLDFNTRNLLEWTGFYGKFTSNAKAAFLTEQYKYYQNLAGGSPNFGRAQTVIAKYDAAYSFSPKIRLNAIGDFTQTTGDGSDVTKHVRKISSLAMLFSHKILEKFGYEIGVRKEITASYASPVLFSAGMDYRFGRHYTLKWNGSRNFRIPTFNDLYWLEGGNPNLKPESSVQTEIGNEIKYKNITVSVTGYLIDISDMIQWLPGTTTVWMPANVNKVRSYGIEAAVSANKKIGRDVFAFSANYGYTVSKDRVSGHQLIYVPYHKASAGLAWSRQKLSADCQVLLNGEVFTRTDNNPRYNIDGYAVANFSAGYSLSKDFVKLGARVFNVFDKKYEVVEGRAFPGRNYSMYLTLNF